MKAVDLGLRLELGLVAACGTLAGLRVLEIHAVAVSTVLGSFGDLRGDQRGRRAVFLLLRLLLLLEGDIGSDPVVTLGIVVIVRLVGSVRGKARVRPLFLV